jgi:hypothetical protein
VRSVGRVVGGWVDGLLGWDPAGGSGLPGAYIRLRATEGDEIRISCGRSSCTPAGERTRSGEAIVACVKHD